MKPRSEPIIPASGPRPKRVDPPAPSPEPRGEVMALLNEATLHGNTLMATASKLEDRLSAMMREDTGCFSVDPDAARTDLGGILAAHNALLMSVNNRLMQILDLLEV